MRAAAHGGRSVGALLDSLTATASGDAIGPMRALSSLLVILAASTAASSAGAQTSRRNESAQRAQAADPVQQAAELHLRTASTAWAERRFDVAAREFEVTWELTHAPELLFNAGSAWEQVPDVERALSALRRFVEAAPGSPTAADARARIGVLERSRARPVTPPPPTPEVTPPTQRPAPQPPQPPVAVTPSPRSHPWRIVAIASGATAGVLGGLAIGLYLSTASDFRQLQSTCAPRCAAADAEGIDRRATITNALLGAAGVTLALSAAALVVDLTTGGRAPAVTASAIPLTDGALGAITGRF